MLWLFIIGIIVAVAGLVAAGYLGLVNGQPGKAAGAVLVGLVIGGLFMWSSCWTTVDARSVGVKTSLSKFSGTLGPGFSHKAPWEDVEEWTTRNQVIRFQGDGGGEERDNYFTEPCVTVRLGNQSNGCVDMTITFNVGEKSVKGLWEQHKTFEAARRDFITPQAISATVQTFDGYNPLAGIAGGVTEVKTVNVGDWTKRLRPLVEQMYAARSVGVVDVQVTFLHYDDDTRNKLAAISSQVAATEIAKEKIKTAEAEAAASAARKAQAGSTCIDLYRDLAAMDQLKNVNAGFNCGQPSGALVNGGPR